MAETIRPLRASKPPARRAMSVTIDAANSAARAIAAPNSTAM